MGKLKMSRDNYFGLRHRNITLSCLLIFILQFLLLGCSVPASTKVVNAGGDVQTISTGYFKHFVALNNHSQSDAAVVVFIDGDGTPWKTKRQISRDPTSPAPLLLNWFLASNFSSAYVGRPCYFSLNDDQCSAYWYTHGRYSERVVASMVNALEQLLDSRMLILVGHSGGGTLAMLMAERMENVSMVVTIAGNLNVAEWVTYHQYSPLTGSLDPMIDLTLAVAVEQVHFYSPKDGVIKAAWIETFASKQKDAQLVEIQVEGHSEGWELHRTEIMAFLQEALVGLEFNSITKGK